MAREFAFQPALLGRQFLDTVGRLSPRLADRFRDEQRITADAFDLLDHEPFDFARRYWAAIVLMISASRDLLKQFFDGPHVIGQPLLDRWRCLDRFVFAAEVVPSEVQPQHRRVVLPLL